MSLKFHWFLPTNGGDGQHIVGGGHGVNPGPASRPADVAYLGQIARGATQSGFDAALTPTGAWCDDAWLSTAMLSQVSERLRFLVAFRPGILAPYLAAQMSGTFQNLTGGRLLLNLVTGGESHEQRMFGDFLDKEGRYERCDEFLTIVRRLWTGDTVDFEGQHLRVEGARLDQIPNPIPEIYFGGSSPAAGQVAAKHVDVYLTWGEPPSAVTEKIAWIRRLVAEEPTRGHRPIRFGIRMHVIARRTSDEAWAEAQRLIDEVDDDTVSRIQAGLQRSESEGQRRMLDLHGGKRDDLEIYPNVWAGVGLVRGGAGTALVGSYEEVADRIAEYAGLGIDEFVLSAYPHLEGAYNFGDGVLPILAERGLWKDPRPAAHHSPAAVPFASAGKAAS